MEFPSEAADRLKALLQVCTANVRVDGASQGSAFFISHNLLLTCQHVVEGQATVDVVPFEHEARTGTVVTPNPGLGDDLALIRVEPVTGEEIPAVLLDRRLDEGQYYLVGYPREHGKGPAQEAYTLTGHPRRERPAEVRADAQQMLQLEAGQVITFGMSGGPVLSLRTGAVVAVTRSARDPNAAEGGGAIPVSVAARRYDELVAPLLSDPPVSTRAWRDAIGREQWQSLGQIWEMATQVDLIVKGKISQWRICSEVVPEGEKLDASALGDDVTEAMFSWAQRRRLSGQPEVDLMGRLLARALFPATVGSHLDLLSQADAVTIRLHIESEVEDGQLPLADIPWELAGIPGKDGFLASEPQFRFVRVDDRGHPDPVKPTLNRLRVLGVIALPKAWEYPEWYGTNHGDWPTSEEIARQLKSQCSSESFGPEAFEFRAVIDPPNDVLSDIIHGLDQVGRDRTAAGEKATYDILHLVGVGRIGQTGQAQYAMSYNDVGDFNWVDLNRLFKWVAGTGVKLVVLQFTGPPVGQRLDPVTPSSVGSVLNGPVAAVILTRFPSHPAQLERFNAGFYRKLGIGATLSDAVQDGRRRLRDNVFGDDAAGFGCFVLITGQQSEIRLVRQQSERSKGGANAQSSRTRTGDDEAPATEDIARTGDTFTSRGW